MMFIERTKVLTIMFPFLFQFAVIYAMLIAYLVSSQCMFDSPSENEFKSTLGNLQAYTKDNPIVITDNDKNFTYTIGICTSVKEGTSIGVTQDAGDKEYNLGVINNAHIQSGSGWMFLEYDGGDAYGGHCTKEGRHSHIMIMCDDDNQIVGSKTVLEENNARTQDCYYLFEITSNAACSISNTSKTSVGLSLGSILIILFICIAFVYLVGGFVYQRFIIGAKGSEQFPNIAFWKDFGNLVADGCDLVFRSSPSDDSPVYRGLGDEDLGLEHATMDQDDDDVQPLY